MVIRRSSAAVSTDRRIGRRPVQDLDLGPVVLPRDAPVFREPFVTQRDQRWFDRPEEFSPGRWAEAAPQRPRFAWFPFGAGPRSCIGEHFGRLVLILAVATIAARWRLTPTRPISPAMRSLLTLKPRGAVWMLAQSRGKG